MIPLQSLHNASWHIRGEQTLGHTMEQQLVIVQTDTLWHPTTSSISFPDTHSYQIRAWFGFYLVTFQRKKWSSQTAEVKGNKFQCCRTYPQSALFWRLQYILYTTTIKPLQSQSKEKTQGLVSCSGQETWEKLDWPLGLGGKKAKRYRWKLTTRLAPGEADRLRERSRNLWDRGIYVVLVKER